MKVNEYYVPTSPQHHTITTYTPPPFPTDEDFQNLGIQEYLFSSFFLGFSRFFKNKVASSLFQKQCHVPGNIIVMI